MGFQAGMKQWVGTLGRSALVVFVLILAIMALYHKNQSKKRGYEYTPKKIQVEYRDAQSLSDIHSIEGPAVKPVLYSTALSLKPLGVEAKKQKFIDLMLPAILVAKHRMYEQCKRVNHLLKGNIKMSRQDSLWLDSLQKVYKAKTPQALIPKLKTHAPSIILAQAALECGWGTSRFFVEANNIFGVWSYNPKEPRIQASMLRGDKPVFVKKYPNLSESVMDYFKTLARVPAYESFRQARMKTSDPMELLPHLKSYSELREIYIKRLSNMIRLNDFQKYDDYFIDPDYFKPAKKLPI